MTLPDHLQPEVDPVARDGAIISGDDYRFTVLSSRTIRLEYDPTGSFEDRATQVVWYRDQPVPEYDVRRDDDGTIHIETDALELTYEATGEGFTPETLSIELLDSDQRWTYGDDQDDLGGAVRTVDAIDGATELTDGMVSRDGWTLVDDTDSLAFDEDGWVTARDRAETYEDHYFIAYGDDYRECLREWTTITGDVPVPPRWALGNWWSRYWAYHQEELKELMIEFQDRDLPLSVCMVDMDWHVIDNEYHYGWTGWTWNDEYFPDPGGFIDWLHENDLYTGVNLHPAEGVHPHEVQYPEFAADMGIDPDTEEPIEFDSTDTDFLSGYFEHLMRPMEDRDGVDFWWIDWQQWDEAENLPGLDPLWALNHLHALDRARGNKRRFILSRWPGLGGHRYPIGFSGDHGISWESLQFQPFLTATSANVQCGWWSHDIGGHYGGTGDPEQFGELYARWLQFGALSPINRMHSTKDRYIDKRPWIFPEEIEGTMREALQLRHRLVPYLYTLARRNYDEAIPMIEPLYYEHPDKEPAYHRPNQYYFGTELIAAPHDHPRDEATNLSRRGVWLPEGTWFDFFDGTTFESGWHPRYGRLDDLPLYAKAGAIVPLADDPHAATDPAPDELRIRVFPGADNEFVLYEDDGTTQDYQDDVAARTTIRQDWSGSSTEVTIEATSGTFENYPSERSIVVEVCGIRNPDDVGTSLDTWSESFESDRNTLAIDLGTVATDETYHIEISTNEADLVAPSEDDLESEIDQLLWTFAMQNSAKPRLLQAIEEDPTDFSWLQDFAIPLSDTQSRALVEHLFDVGVEHIEEADDDRLVLWNASGTEHVTYRFAAWDPRRPVRNEGESEAGPLPEFEVIDLEEWADDRWELEVRCAGEVIARYEG